MWKEAVIWTKFAQLSTDDDGKVFMETVVRTRKPWTE